MPGERQVLDSWKEIASYLGRTEKTCREWERQLGLPVHRLIDKPKARVFAYADEIDAWRDQRGHLPAPQEAGTLPTDARPPRTAPGKTARIVSIAAAMAGIVLLAWMLAAWLPWRKGDTDPARPAERSVAVLPFIELSAGREYDYLCEAMTDMVINALTTVPGLRVPARASAFQFKDRHRDIRDIGRKLRVETVLEATVQINGEDIRVAVHLQDCRTGSQLWSKIYDGRIADVFALQDEMAQAIVGVLSVGEAAIAGKTLVRAETTDPEAITSYLKGRYHLERGRGKNFWTAISHFRAALDKDPLMAGSYAGMAAAYHYLSANFYLAPNEALPLAKAAALKALEISSGNAEAHAVLGAIKAHYEWDMDAAEQNFLRSIAINPGYAAGHHMFAFFLIQRGRPEEAIREMEIAYDLDPLSSRIRANVGCILYLAGHFEEAQRDLTTAIRQDPANALAHAYYSEILAMRGRYREAVESGQRAIEVGGEDLWVELLIALYYALWGKADEAARTMERVNGLAAESYVSPTLSAAVLEALGKTDEAFVLLENAFLERDFDLNWLDHVWEYQRLRSDPRCRALRVKYGLDASAR